MTKQTIIFTLSIFFLLTFCGSDTTSDVKDGPGSFSCRNGHIAFTYFKNNVASIYFTKSVDSVARQLTFPKTGWDITSDLSHDLLKILYVNYPNKDYETCNICIHDIISGKSDTLLKTGKIITDVCLSNDNKYVYYLAASEIKNYSPIAAAAPHGIDVYELNIKTKSIRKLTDLRAYDIRSLTTTFSDTIIAATLIDHNEGLIMISTNSGKFKGLEINSPRNQVKEWFSPVSIRADSLLYEAPYQLYKHNLKTNQSELILRSPYSHFDIIQPDEGWKNILFSSNDRMYFYNVPDKKLTTLSLKIE